MLIGIDASNIRAGGGLTHLKELLSAADPMDYNIRQITVWGGNNTLDYLPERIWLNKVYVPDLDKGILSRLLWQRRRLPTLAAATCDLLFVPGGNFSGGYGPTVVMAQNLLPFDVREQRRFGLSYTRFRLFLLKYGQTASMRRADGLIFLSEATQRIIWESIGRPPVAKKVIPHGISTRFFREPREQLPLSAFSLKRPFRLLYVSIVNFYKHQWTVVEAVCRLRKEGIPVAIDLVGPAYPPALKHLNRAIQRFDPAGEAVSYRGPEPYETLSGIYQQADGFVFASSCETISIITMEAMAAGLPIACSNVPPMPEVLGDAGVYFDPENVDEITATLRKMVSDSVLRAEIAQKAYDRSQQFTWERCAHETFTFLTSFNSAG